MADYKKYDEMIVEHIRFLQSQGFNIETLEIGSTNLVRCRELESTTGRGELVYKTTKSTLKNDLTGLATWCRGSNGEATFKNYGLDQTEGALITVKSEEQESSVEECELNSRKAYGFWKHSSITGESDYLLIKNVGAYGLRFRSGLDYGNVAVVPMLDINGKLWSYQLLNPNGTKRHPKGRLREGLFHCLAPLIDGKCFGIAESYSTAATCHELTGLPVVCAFSCENLKAVTKVLNERYPNSPIVLFADNDRHLKDNQGTLKAQEAYNLIKGRRFLAIPDFGDYEPNKSATDWNDLVRLKGKSVALDQLRSPKPRSL